MYTMENQQKKLHTDDGGKNENTDEVTDDGENESENRQKQKNIIIKWSYKSLKI